MGTDYTFFRVKPGHKETRDYIDSQYTWENEKTRCEVVRSSIRRGAYYAAIRVTRKEENTVDICAEVVKVTGYHDEYGGYWLGLKAMSENMGPCFFDCPVRILDLLPETDNAAAIEWRRRCREKKSLSALRVGSVIRFSCPFSNGQVARGEVITLEKMTAYRRRPYWFDGLYRWPVRLIPENYEVLQEVTA